MKNILFSIILIFLFLSCNKRQTANDQVDYFDKIENQYIYNMDRIEEFNIDYVGNNISVLRTWILNKNDMFLSDFTGNDYFIFTESYRKRYNEYDRKDRVLIAYTKEDLEFIEANYINSRYLKKIPSDYFDENILVFISFYFGSTQYLKNINIINKNNKYLFTVEVWEQMLIAQGKHGIILGANHVLFIVNIEK